VVAEALADVLGESYVVAVGVRDRDDDLDEMHGDLGLRYNIYSCCIVFESKDDGNDDFFGETSSRSTVVTGLAVWQRKRPCYARLAELRRAYFARLEAGRVFGFGEVGLEETSS